MNIEYRFKVVTVGFSGTGERYVVGRTAGERRKSTVAVTRNAAVGYMARISTEQWDQMAKDEHQARSEWIARARRRVEISEAEPARLRGELATAEKEAANYQVRDLR